MAAAAVLEARAINAWRGDRHVLRDVSFTVTAGEFLKVTGPNGIGKTTLLRVLCGLLMPESGVACWRGRTVSQADPGFTADLAYLGHANALKSDLTARENLHYLVGMRRRLTAAGIDTTLDRVGIGGCGALPARVLSAGQRRRLTLARLLLWPAALWILDEPATNLDADGLALAESLIREHVQGGGLVVAAAHQRLLDGEAGTRRLELA